MLNTEYSNIKYFVVVFVFLLQIVICFNSWVKIAICLHTFRRPSIKTFIPVTKQIMVLVENYEKVNRCKLWLKKTKSSESLEMISLSVFSNTVEIRGCARHENVHITPHQLPEALISMEEFCLLFPSSSTISLTSSSSTISTLIIGHSAHSGIFWPHCNPQ